MHEAKPEQDPTARRIKERYFWKEEDKERLQELAVKFKNGTVTEEEKGTFLKFADAYVESHQDVSYYADHPSNVTSFMEYIFCDLGNGLHLEGEAGNHQNAFTFSHNVLTTEETDKRIAYLESTWPKEDDQK